MNKPGPRPGKNPVREDGLTERQAEFFREMFERTRKQGYQPTAREMSRFLGSEHPGTATTYLYALAKKGWVGAAPGEGKFTARAVKFLRRPDGRPFRGFR